MPLARRNRLLIALAAVGLVGTDANGDWILRDCEAAGIDISQLQQTDRAPTNRRRRNRTFLNCEGRGFHPPWSHSGPDAPEGGGREGLKC